jgi:hypothetical protein
MRGKSKKSPPWKSFACLAGILAISQLRAKDPPQPTPTPDPALELSPAQDRAIQQVNDYFDQSEKPMRATLKTAQDEYNLALKAKPVDLRHDVIHPGVQARLQPACSPGSVPEPFGPIPGLPVPPVTPILCSFIHPVANLRPSMSYLRQMQDILHPWSNSHDGQPACLGPWINFERHRLPPGFNRIVF